MHAHSTLTRTDTFHTISGSDPSTASNSPSSRKDPHRLDPRRSAVRRFARPAHRVESLPRLGRESATRFSDREMVAESPLAEA